jgi:hypothetical protein
VKGLGHGQVLSAWMPPSIAAEGGDVNGLGQFSRHGR